MSAEDRFTGRVRVNVAFALSEGAFTLSENPPCGHLRARPWSFSKNYCYSVRARWRTAREKLIGSARRTSRARVSTLLWFLLPRIFTIFRTDIERERERKRERTSFFSSQKSSASRFANIRWNLSVQVAAWAVLQFASRLARVSWDSDANVEAEDFRLSIKNGGQSVTESGLKRPDKPRYGEVICACERPSTIMDRIVDSYVHRPPPAYREKQKEGREGEREREREIARYHSRIVGIVRLHPPN